MFSHIFFTRLKCILRDRHAMFWTLLFPIFLSTVFYFAFSNLSKEYDFAKINIAVVNSAQFQKDTTFSSALDSVSGKSKTSGTKQLFNVTYCEKEKADALLRDGKIEGYITDDSSPKLVIKQSGDDQSIIKIFLDQYRSTFRTAQNILKTNPAAMAAFSKNLDKSVSYLHDVSPSSAKPDEMLVIYYALIGMACLYGGSFGLKEVTAVQANVTPQGARINLAPVNKLKVFLSAICAATIVQFFCTAVLILYLVFVLKIDLGTKVPGIILACVASCFTGVSMGAFISAIIKTRGDSLKSAVLFGFTMISSLFSGLYGTMDLKYIAEKYCPVLAKINPAIAITDTFYSLYYYDGYSRFISDIVVLAGLSVVFYLGVFLVLRRQKYESI